jgi:hypothetical protein
MPQSSIFAFHPSHIGLTDNLVAIRNELGIDRIAITNIEKAVLEADEGPQWGKGFSTAVTHNPRQNALSKVVYRGPNPDFVFL